MRRAHIALALAALCLAMALLGCASKESRTVVFVNVKQQRPLPAAIILFKVEVFGPAGDFTYDYALPDGGEIKLPASFTITVNAVVGNLHLKVTAFGEKSLPAGFGEANAPVTAGQMTEATVNLEPPKPPLPDGGHDAQPGRDGGVDGRRPDLPAADRPRGDAPRSDRPAPDRARVDGQRADSPRVDGSRPDQPRIDGPVADRPPPDAPPAPVGMVTVPGGEFMMGTPNGDIAVLETVCKQECPQGACSQFSWETPEHVPFIDTFFIDKYEVTNGDYGACVTAGKCPQRDLPKCYCYTDQGWRQGVPVPFESMKDDHPAICVTKAQAESYCEWRSKRLPTEAEWEKAARGGAPRTYPWGEADPSCDRVAIKSCTGGDRVTAKVGTHADGASPFGAHDMAGNAAELVSDWFAPDYYSVSPRDNPQGPAAPTGLGSVRGGSVLDDMTPMCAESPTRLHLNLRTAARAGVSPEKAYFDVGFRCAAR